jgi:probable phosphoglycerate mutase
LRIALIRHGPTDWNAQRRVQGRIDLPLSADGEAKMARLLPPVGFETARPFASPQLRARQTAALLGLENPTLDARLIEQNWGEWEGLTREEMLARDGKDAFTRAGRGLHFRPPGGESTGELQARVASFFADAAKLPQDGVAVTHMGVLRTAYALATGWDMSTPMPDELDLAAALVLSLDANGTATIAQLNAPLRVRR